MVERVPGWKPVTGAQPGATFALHEEARRVTLLADGRPSAPPAGRAAALELFRATAQLHVAEFAPQRVFVHAGVVAWRGRAIVLPGRSFTGKTTLVRALLQKGASYLSDEYAVIDSRGSVHPYVRPLQIRAGGRLLRRSAQALGATVEFRARRMGAVIITQFREGAVWEPSMVSPGQAVLELFANTVSAQREPRRAMQWLARAVGAQTVVLAGPRGDAGDAAGRLLAAVETWGRGR